MCKQRVDQRVLEGGHNVDDNTISERYLNGLVNFDKYFYKYDFVIMLDNSTIGEIKQLFVYTEGKVVYADEKLVEIVSVANLENLKLLIKDLMNSHPN